MSQISHHMDALLIPLDFLCSASLFPGVCPGPACHINDDEQQQQGPGQCFEGTHDALDARQNQRVTHQPVWQQFDFWDDKFFYL